MPPMGGGMGRGYLTEEEKANRPKVTLPLLKRIFSYLLPYWKQMVIVLGCILVLSILGLLLSVLTGRIIDEGLIGRDLKMLITRMTSDISGVERVITSTFTSILSNSITLICAVVIMYRENWILATVGVLVIPLFTIPTRWAGKTRWTLTREAQECNDEVNGLIYTYF